MPLTASERRLHGQIGAHKSWARTPDRAARTLPARLALDAKWENQVDPERQLAPAERAKRAQNARKEHYTKMALKSAQVRRARKEGAA